MPGRGGTMVQATIVSCSSSLKRLYDRRLASLADVVLWGVCSSLRTQALVVTTRRWGLSDKSHHRTTNIEFKANDCDPPESLFCYALCIESAIDYPSLTGVKAGRPR